MTPEQQQTLIAQGLVDRPQWYKRGRLANLSALADYVNELSSVWVWRSSVAATDLLGAGFDVASVASASPKAITVQDALLRLGTVSLANEQIRAAVALGWPSPDVQAKVRASAMRLATRAEATFAIGDGTTSSPSTLVLDGPVLWQDFIEERPVTRPVLPSHLSKFVVKRTKDLTQLWFFRVSEQGGDPPDLELPELVSDDEVYHFVQQHAAGEPVTRMAKAGGHRG